MFGLFALFACLGVLLGNVAVLTAENEVVTLDLVSEGYGPRGHRAKRDVRVDAMPEVLTFEMKLRDKALTLRLTKSGLLTVATEDVETTLQANKVPTDSAVYTDPRYASTFIVHRNNGSYNLTGTFTLSGATWSLEPVEGDSSKPKAVASHKVGHIGSAQIINYGNDGVKDTIERPELIHTKEYAHLFKHPGHRSKRALTRHVIEIAFVVDNADYLKWVAYYGQANALLRTRLWYTYVADSMKGMYESITDPDISITTTATVLKILTTAAQDAFIANITTNNQFDANVGLGLFAAWAQNQADIPPSDHYMLFTGRDILSAAGMAFVARVCTVQGVSIVENGFTGLVPHIAAHELGHSISSDHDSQTGGNCTDSDQFIMAAIAAVYVTPGNEGKSWTFSNCSINKFKTYLSTKNCTRPEYTSVVNVLPSPVQGQRGGDILSKDDQCRLALNSSLSSYYLGTTSDQQRVCSGMWCRVPNTNSLSMVRPLAYTACGTGMVCVQGFCVPDITTTTTSTTTTTTTTPTTTASTTTTTKPTTTTPTTTTTKPTTTTPTTTTTKPTTTTPTTTTTRPTSTTPTTTTTKPTTTTPTTTTTKPTTTTPTTTTTKPTTTTPTTTTTRPTSTTPTTTTTKPTSTTPTTTTTRPTTTTPTTTTTKPTSTTPTTTTTRPTTTTTTTPSPSITTTTAKSPPRSEADCYLDPYYRIGTRLAECLLYIWQHA